MAKGLFRAAGLGASLSLAALCGATAQGSAETVTAAPLNLTALLTAPPAETGITPTADLIAPPVLEPPVAQPWIWAITPRAWFLWENDFYFQEENRFFQQSNEAVFIPFAGGSVSVTPGAGAPTYSLTALYGEGSSDVVGLGAQEDLFGFLFPVGFESDVEIKRLDVEAIAQIPAAEGISWILGARFIRFDRHEEATFFELDDLTNFATSTFDLEQHFYLAEAGFGVNRPINGTGSIFAFGNLVGMLGFADVVKTSDEIGIFNVPKTELQGGVFGVDTNAGLGYRLSPNLFASARYRLFYLTAPEFKFKDGGTFMHGPEVNLTFTFGG